MHQVNVTFYHMTKSDGKHYKLNDAVEKLIFNGMPYIISCIPGKLAYFQGEHEQGEPVRYLFKR